MEIGEGMERRREIRLGRGMLLAGGGGLGAL